jgi:hypothetical protein
MRTPPNARSICDQHARCVVVARDILPVLDVGAARFRVARDEGLRRSIGAGAAARRRAGAPTARMTEQRHEPRTTRARHDAVRDRPVDSADDAMVVPFAAAVARTAHHDCTDAAHRRWCARRCQSEVSSNRWRAGVAWRRTPWRRLTERGSREQECSAEMERVRSHGTVCKLPAIHRSMTAVRWGRNAA